MKVIRKKTVALYPKQIKNSMTVQEAIQARHSVRAYKNEPLADDVVKALEEQIAVLNSEGKLHMQLILNEPKAFQGTLAKYGKFRNVNNYMNVPGLEVNCSFFDSIIILT